MSEIVNIKSIEIQRFRGLENVIWNPDPGMNIILGGGDSGKTTILEAIGLLFSPVNSLTLSETDFWQRISEDEFCIVATISVSDDFEFSSGTKTYWPWEWNGQKAVLPTSDSDEPSEQQTPVFKVSLTANSDFELLWEIIQPNDEREHFPVGLRRKIGVVKLTSEDKNDRDLRLVYGSALDRLLSDNTLRSKIAHIISQYPLTKSLSEDAMKSLNDLDQKQKERALPSGLDLGITGSQGISVGALISLFATKDSVKLPLTNWGAGTRRMSSFAITSSNADNDEIILIDEIERGLEPYRLRQFINSLIDEPRQSFITTHSPVAISSSHNAQLWYLDATSNIGALDKKTIRLQQERDPETFLSKIPIIVEGQTEQGFVSKILCTVFKTNPQYYGIRVCLGQGDDQMLPVLEALSRTGLTFAAFADNDEKSSGRWEKVKEAMNDRLFRWESGCTEANIISLLPENYLPKLFIDPDGDYDGYRLRTIADRLGNTEQNITIESIQANINEQKKNLRKLIIDAATGNTEGVEDKSTKKSWKKHSQSWFKKADGSGGAELVDHLLYSSSWTEIEPKIRPFFNNILTLAGLSPVEKIKI